MMSQLAIDNQQRQAELLSLADQCGLLCVGWNTEYGRPITIGTIQQRRKFEELTNQYD
jgi:hypothetical protein